MNTTDRVPPRLGIGIVGCGYAAKNAWAEFLPAGCEIKAVVGLQREEAESFICNQMEFPPEDVDALQLGEYSDMLQRPDIDAVFIATPHSLHKGQVIAAAEAGKHVYCEKPMAPVACLDDALAMRDAVKENNVVFALNSTYTEHTLADKIREGIDANENIRYVKGVYYLDYQNTADKPFGWRRNPEYSAGGMVINDMGFHLLWSIYQLTGAYATEIDGDVYNYIRKRQGMDLLDHIDSVQDLSSGCHSGIISGPFLADDVWAATLKMIRPGNEFHMHLDLSGVKEIANYIEINIDLGLRCGQDSYAWQPEFPNLMARFIDSEQQIIHREGEPGAFDKPKAHPHGFAHSVRRKIRKWSRLARRAKAGQLKPEELEAWNNQELVPAVGIHHVLYSWTQLGKQTIQYDSETAAFLERQ